MGEINITVNSNDLHDTTESRRIYGNISVVEKTGASIIAKCQVLIQGTDSDDLHTNWATAKTKFNTTNQDVDITLDDGEGSTLESISNGDGKHSDIVTSIYIDPTQEQTDTSLMCVFEMTANSLDADGDGLVDGLVLTINYNEGGVQTRNIQGSYVSTSGSTALENYEADIGSQMSTYLLTGVDGSRGVSKLAVIDRQVKYDNDNDELTFNITSGYNEIGLTGISSSQRRIELQINSFQPEEWDTAGGTRPTIIEVTGSIACDVDSFVIKNSTWDTIKADIISQVESKTGKSGIKMTQLHLSSSENINTLAFQAAFLADNVDTFKYIQVMSEMEEARYVKWMDSDGYHRVQQMPGPNDAILSIKVERVGTGTVDIVPLLPFRGLTDPNKAYTYKLIKQQLSEHGPLESEGYTDIYKQSGTFTYDRLRPSPFIGGSGIRLGIR